MKRRNLILYVFLIATTLSCRVFAPKQQTTLTPKVTLAVSPDAAHPLLAGGRVFENENFSFTIPSGWKTQEEVWGKPMPSDADYYGLGLITLITIQYPSGQGKGRVFFSVASSPLAGGVDLEGRFTSAYAKPVPEIKELSRGPYDQNGLSGFEITYDRPWGEPWWRFHDIWLEKEAVIYMLSFHSSPDSYDTYSDMFEKIVDSFTFKK
jgi:hypothetical protein